MTGALLLVLDGALAGLLAGFFGIGGGIVLVPALIFLFESQRIAPEIVTQLSVGTSLAAIIFTGSASAWAHNKKGNVDWPIVWSMGLFIIIGTQLGALFAGKIDGGVLKRLFGVFEFFVAARMLWTAGPASRPIRLSPMMVYPVGGIAIGTVSSLFGIGGGTLTVPLLVYLLDRPIKIAVGTASAQGVVIALFGTVGFIYQGWGRPSLPAGAWGFVSLSAALLIAATSALTAPVGARWVDRINPTYLSRAFGVLLILVGIKLVGLF